MHILFLNEYYPPDTSATASLAASFAEALAARHHVTVLAGRPSYDPSEHHPPYLLRREVCGNVAVERVGSTAFPRFRMRHRLSNYLTYLALALPRALTIKADVVVAMTDPPIEGIAGALVSRLTGQPFVYNIQDLYPEMAVGGDIVRPSGWVRQWERAHRWALQRAARVVVIGDDMRDRIIAKGVDPARVVVVRAGVRLPVEIPAPGHPVTQEIRSGFRFVALHAGNLGFYGAWDTLLEAARRLGKDGVGMVFVGEGAQKERLVAAAHGADAVRFFPFRPANEVSYVLSAGDVHIVTVKHGLEGVIVPSKLYPILATGKPVLVVSSPGTDVARIVTRAACGVLADPDDPESVVAAIRELAAHPERVIEMGSRAQAIASGYDKVTQLKNFLNVIEEVMQE